VRAPDNDKPGIKIEDLDGRDFAVVNEAADILRCDPRTVRRGCEDGTFPGVRIGAEWRIPVRWLREQAGAAVAA
jgi:excisionase family DNA binding protein